VAIDLLEADTAPRAECGQCSRGSRARLILHTGYQLIQATLVISLRIISEPLSRGRWNVLPFHASFLAQSSPVPSEISQSSEVGALAPCLACVLISVKRWRSKVLGTESPVKSNSSNQAARSRCAGESMLLHSFRTKNSRKGHLTWHDE
jgi:hypothetical protein